MFIKADILLLHCEIIKKMKKSLSIFTITLLSFFTSEAQINYDSLIHNLEDVTSRTKFKVYFKGLKYTKEYTYEDHFTDERFLRFHGVIVDDVVFDYSNWSNDRLSSLSLKLYDEVDDYNILLKKLTELYGDPVLKEEETTKRYVWSSSNTEIIMKIELIDGEFAKFNEFTIDF